MDLARRLFRFIGWQHAVARPDAFQHSHLGKLPNEIILHIASYLPLESAASFSICCCRFYNCMKTEYLPSLKLADPSIQENFLALLEHDLPMHILCPDCKELHSIANAFTHVPSRRHFSSTSTQRPRLQCWKSDTQHDIRRSIHTGFCSTIFRMAMKTHRLGRNSRQLLQFLSYEPRTTHHRGFIEQNQAAARIVDDSLLVREQTVFMVPSSQRIPIPWHGFINICNHIGFPGFLDLHRRGAVHIPQANELGTFVQSRRGLICCKHCYTEFRVDFKSYGESGNAMFVTRWMDIGEGRDPKEVKFTSRHVNLYQETWAKVNFRGGSICAAFEEMPAAEFVVDSLLSAREERVLCKGSNLPWPEDVSVSCDRVERSFGVMSGRFVPF
ncbi:uncharacterized protein LY89DRAFT_123379 [Mollisia scopiformis]|uniref:F-box domain-containing protein n=1 Tax=Mollisia scopiformis TaxID=149040 RepID=A0A194X3T9_MOLSC|nr:uncharacterized protein LY89DRAFT_123379 [Mollisia scopiformis]KUJ14836.1 hypothetical protein LY89DRAFT_123379 [Mollisia scopiformis]